MKPLAVDLFCGLGGWTDGFLAEGYDVIGFDIEQRPYPGQLVLQDALTITGAQLARLPNLAAIVASPPCTEYSYMAMPWSRGKQIAAALREEVPFPEGYTGSRTVAALNALFLACFRIQREASEAAGREIPMVVENVKGAQPWVGRARANFGSFYLWGDVDSIGGRIVRRGPLQFGMPAIKSARSRKVLHRYARSGSWKNENGADWRDPSNVGVKVPGLSWSGSDQPGYVAKGFNVTAAQRSRDGSKNDGGSWFNEAHNTTSGKGNNPDGRKGKGGGWFSDPDENGERPNWKESACVTRAYNSKDPRRAQATAEIAMIPPPLARHIAQIFKPRL